MRGISTLNLLLKGSLFSAALTAGSFNAFSQEQGTTEPGTITRECTPVELADCIAANITFEHESGTGGHMYDFTSDDFILEGANSQNANSDFYLKSTPVVTGEKRLNSFWFSPNKQALSVDYRFELSGTADVTTYRIYLQSRTTGLYYGVCTELVDLSNSGPAIICGTAGVPLALTGDFRFVFFFSIEGANSHYIEFDNFGSNLLLNEGALPVNFVGLTARKGTKGAEVLWKVADEFNVSRYEVQKGTDGGNFKTIGVVFAGEKSSYSFTDEQPSQGVSFYRIRSIDVDGKFKFSTVISFSNGKSAAILRAYPMPARDQVTLQHGAIEGKAQITISSEDGRIVKRQVLATGSMLTPIDLSSLKAGLYLLRLENSNGEVETLKLVKQ